MICVARKREKTKKESRSIEETERDRHRHMYIHADLVCDAAALYSLAQPAHEERDAVKAVAGLSGQWRPKHSHGGPADLLDELVCIGLLHLYTCRLCGGEATR